MPAWVARTTRVPTTPTPTPVALAPPLLLKPSREGAAPVTPMMSIPTFVARTILVPAESQARAVPVPDPVMLVTTLAVRFGAAGKAMVYFSTPRQGERPSRRQGAAEAHPAARAGPVHPPHP